VLAIKSCLLRDNWAYSDSNVNSPAGGGGSGFFRIFTIGQTAEIYISGLTIADGYSIYTGGGILNNGFLSLIDCNIMRNYAIYHGGGILNEAGATLRLTGCVISGNRAQTGGGIKTHGTATVLNCTISGNTSSYGSVGACSGGGIEIANGTATVSNSTIFGNSATNGQGGGLSNCGAGVAKVRSSVVAGNVALYGPDWVGVITSQDFNLVLVPSAYGPGIGGPGVFGVTNHNLYGLDPLLGPLQDNGGPTWTHALRPGSPALDAGHSGGLATDQRGGARAVRSTTNSPPGDGSDIGAFEAGGFVRLTSLTRTNRTAHLQFTKDATTAPVPLYHVQRRAAFGIGDWETLPPGPIGSTNTLVPFPDPSATNAQNFYRVRVGP
jgi:hypothetical protein